MRVDPKRFKGLYGAARAAELSNQREKGNRLFCPTIRKLPWRGALGSARTSPRQVLLSRRLTDENCSCPVPPSDDFCLLRLRGWLLIAGCATLK